MNALGQYFTPTTLSQLLVASLADISPRIAVDLGAGQGSLLGAANKRWPEARLYAAEIDQAAADRLRSRFPEAKLVCGDGLCPHTPRRLELYSGSVDIAICNPPYRRTRIRPHHQRWLVEAGLPGAKRLTQITSDLLFLAQNLRLLRHHGQLGIILPDTLITGKAYRWLRDDLIAHHGLLGIIQLPEASFRGTEARTHVLLLEKGGHTGGPVSVAKASLSGDIQETIDIGVDHLSERMDHRYLAWLTHQTAKQGIVPTLGSIGAVIKRGSRTKAYFEQAGLSCVHTAQFDITPNPSKSLPSASPHEQFVTAEKGDILMARVGRRCVGRVLRVTEGNLPITDCVYRIRVPQDQRDVVWGMLTSRYGRGWIDAHTHGVCATVLSKSDLMQFPAAVR